MTEQFDDAVVGSDSFRRNLHRLLADAHERGVDVEGAWECRSVEDDRPDWEVEIVRLSGGEQRDGPFEE